METCTNFNKILHTLNNIHFEHYTLVSQKSAWSLRTYEILNNTAECQEFSNAANVSQNSPSDIQGVFLSPRYIYAVNRATDALFRRQCSDQSFFQMIDVVDVDWQRCLTIEHADG